MDNELAFAPATEIRRLIASGEVSSVELTELFYQRIDALNPQLNAYLALCPTRPWPTPAPPTRPSSAAIPSARSTASPSPSRTWN